MGRQDAEHRKTLRVVAVIAAMCAVAAAPLVALLLLPGSSSPADRHLAVLQRVTAAFRPPSASLVERIRDDECGSGDNNIMETLRTTDDVQGLFATYAASLRARGWRIDQMTPGGTLSWSKRFAWGSAYFSMSQNPQPGIYDTDTGYSCYGD